MLALLLVVLGYVTQVVLLRWLAKRFFHVDVSVGAAIGLPFAAALTGAIAAYLVSLMDQPLLDLSASAGLGATLGYGAAVVWLTDLRPLPALTVSGLSLLGGFGVLALGLLLFGDVAFETILVLGP